MSVTVLFLHGMGTISVEQADDHLTLLREFIPFGKFFSLFYGDILENAPLYRASVEDESIVAGDSSSGETYEDGFVDGYVAHMLNISPSSGIIPAGLDVTAARRVASNVYRHATRYLLGRSLYTEVQSRVIDQTLQIVEEQNIEPKSMVLLGYSLGSVVSLDLLHHPDVGRMFARFVSVGSPLGGLGAVARIPFSDVNVLDKWRREVPVKWFDVAIRNDPVALIRVSGMSGFSGSDGEITLRTLSKWVPTTQQSWLSKLFGSHGAYFLERSIVTKWIKYLNVK